MPTCQWFLRLVCEATADNWQLVRNLILNPVSKSYSPLHYQATLADAEDRAPKSLEGDDRAPELLEGDTVLHVTCRLAGRASERDDSTSDAVAMAAWLLELGAPVNTLNCKGETAHDAGGSLWKERWAKFSDAAYTGRGTQLGDMLGELRRTCPLLDSDKHKGQAGRVGVVGGTLEYTGAPFYAALSSLKVGADLSFVFCHEGAAGPIKSYSPELVVYPVFQPSLYQSAEEAQDAMVATFLPVVPRLHVIVVGPGLGRSKDLVAGAAKLVQCARAKGLGAVIDADGLHLVAQNLELARGWTNLVLTPNIPEFTRLLEAVAAQAAEKPPECDGSLDSLKIQVEYVARQLGGCTVVRKGAGDIISDGTTTLICTETGSVRRCGGQGDVLSGSISTWLNWCLARQREEGKVAPVGGPTLAAYAGCVITRRCSAAAFRKHGRAMTAPDLLSEIASVMENLVPAVGNGLNPDGSLQGGWEPFAAHRVLEEPDVPRL